MIAAAAPKALMDAIRWLFIVFFSVCWLVSGDSRLNICVPTFYSHCCYPPIRHLCIEHSRSDTRSRFRTYGFSHRCYTIYMVMKGTMSHLRGRNPLTWVV